MTQVQALFHPTSVAIIGASNRPQRPGYLVLRNLLSGDFQGPIMPVTPKYASVSGVLAYPTIESLPLVPDLAIVCTHAKRNLHMIEELGIKGVKMVIVLAAGMNTRQDEQPHSLTQAMKEIAKKWQMRIIGPNSLGLILPWLGLNASFSPISAHQGNIAFISQSAAVCTTILDWAKNKGVGFSLFLSLGDSCDLHFDEILDALMKDGKTQSILLYIDHIQDARRFMSAARAIARYRRVLVLKSGRTPWGTDLIHQHMQQHTVTTLDTVYDAAISRAGLLRVKNTHELFAAVETLSYAATSLRGERLAILSNGYGPAIMAVDTLFDYRGTLTTFSQSTTTELQTHLPYGNIATNPLDLSLDADAERYKHSLMTLLDSNDFDALLIIHSPSAMGTGESIAQCVIDVLRDHPKAKHINILTNWSGENEAAASRRILTQAGYPTYRTPESAVAAFMHLVEYRRNQKQLRETPTPLTQNAPFHRHFNPSHYLQQRVQRQHWQLETDEVAPLVNHYGLHSMPIWQANHAGDAVQVANKIGYPVALKWRGSNIPHKSEIDGIRLHLRNDEEVLHAVQSLQESSYSAEWGQQVEGFFVQKMADRAGSQELRISITSDPIFGPVIFVGDDVIDWHPQRDAVAALPPLNMTLARYLISNGIKTQKIRQRGLKTLNQDALSRLLITLSQIIIDHPTIAELHLHPLLANDNELTIIDASMRLQPFKGEAQKRLAIRPYPKEHESSIILKNGNSIFFRPILPEDEPMHKAFIQSVSTEDRYRRFFSNIGEFNHEILANFTQIDFDREMAFIALENHATDSPSIIGVVRALIESDNSSAEFAVLIRSDKKGIGLGVALMKKLIDYSHTRGIGTLTGITMPSNHTMIFLAKKLGFNVDIDIRDDIVNLLFELQPNA